MRDILNIIDKLTEASNLAPNEILSRAGRFEKFIEKIKSRSPFTTVAGDEVIIDPREAKRFTDLRSQDKFKGSLKARTTDGEEIPLSDLAKTTEFGGGAAVAGQEPSKAGKETLLVKPSQIGITDKDIPAENFYSVIARNKILSSTDYGQVIQQLAEYIVAGEYVMFPEEYRKSAKEKVRKAIVDYGGEYLGVLALLYGRSRFPRKAQFEQWLGSSIEELVLNFPSKVNTNLADSYATIENPNTSHKLNISSKGTGGGAAPAISGLKVPDYVRSDPNFESAVAFIDICQKQDTLQQAFSAMDLIYSINPDALDKKWLKYLPFASKNPDLPALCRKSIASKTSQQRIGIPAKYHPLIKGISGAGTEGGILVYAIKKEVERAINQSEGIPGFEAAILQILEMNFIQQYADYKGGELTFATQWPAKLDGKVSVENKSTTNDPTGGGFSFKLGRVDDSVSSEPGEAEVDGDPEIQEPQTDFATAATSLAGGPTRSVKPRETEPRKKRK